MPTHAGHHGRTAFVQDDAEAARTQWRQVRPIKVLGIEHGVNVTVGLPVVRTSVDHGTAFDIAGTGCAEESFRDRRRSAPRHCAVRGY